MDRDQSIHDGQRALESSESDWLDAMLLQANLNATEQPLTAQDADFTKRVVRALPARFIARSYWRLLPIATVLGSVSVALWYLTSGLLTQSLDHPTALFLQLVPLAILYWLCWETCFAERQSTL